MPARPSSEIAGPSIPSREIDPGGPGRSCGEDSAWVYDQVRAIASAWARGEDIAVEELLERRPGLKTEDAIRLVYEEICLRREAGQGVSTAEVVCRFPQWKEELEILLGCDRLLRPLSRTATLPEVGER